MEKIKVLIVDDNQGLVDMVKDYFENHNRIEVVQSCKDGEEGLDAILNKGSEFDIILLDLVMPKKDGLYVLEELSKRGIEKNIIVETSYNEPKIIRKVSEYGVNYYILKPFDLMDLENRIMEIFNDMGNKSINLYHSNLQISITKMLHELGMPSHIKGYQYIRTGIILMFDNKIPFGLPLVPPL